MWTFAEIHLVSWLADDLRLGKSGRSFWISLASNQLLFLETCFVELSSRDQGRKRIGYMSKVSSAIKWSAASPR